MLHILPAAWAGPPRTFYLQERLFVNLVTLQLGSATGGNAIVSIPALCLMVCVLRVDAPRLWLLRWRACRVFSTL